MIEQIALADFLAMVAAVHIYIKLNFTPQQRYPHALPQLLEAFAALPRSEPHNVPALHEEQVVHQEFFLLEELGHELAVFTPSEYASNGAPYGGDYKEAHCTSKGKKPSLLLRASSLTAWHHVDPCFSLTSAASQVGMAAFVSALFYCWLCRIPRRDRRTQRCHSIQHSCCSDFLTFFAFDLLCQ